MATNKTNPTNVSVDDFLANIDIRRSSEAHKIIQIMEQVSGVKPVMWGPSIIGFGKTHYKYESGREGDMPQLGFSPRKASITIYFSEGFDSYASLLEKLGKHKVSVSCLYIHKLEDIDLSVLRQMLAQSYELDASPPDKPDSVDSYIAHVPKAALPHFNELRLLAKKELPIAKEVLSYGIVGYKIDDKRARVFISGWKDHTAIYPVPKDEALRAELKPYIKGKGTLWFSLDKPLPKDLIIRTIRSLVK